MISKFKNLILVLSVFLVFSCAGSEADKKLGNALDTFEGKFKYSPLFSSHKVNRVHYYRDNLNDFLATKYDGKLLYSGTSFNAKIENKSEYKSVVREIHKTLSDYCVLDKKNYPKFHERFDQNSLIQYIKYNDSDLEVYRSRFKDEDVGKYIGTFSCFKRNLGEVWDVSVAPKVNKKEVTAILIKADANYSTSQESQEKPVKNKGLCINGDCKKLF